ncbi:carbohydrate-binding domain-containing protein [Lawsonibacter sp. LCP25S3_F5]
MKRTWTALALAGAMVFQLAACGASNSGGGSSSANSGTESALVLSDQSVTLDGNTISEGTDGAVTVSHDIVYYQAGQGEDYGAGSADDEHTAEEAGAHTVVTIRKAGTYRVSGSLSAGQLAVDLGDDAKTDPSSVVTLILDGVDITCTVAPAVIFYNVYECDADFVAYDNEETDNYVSSPTVDTSAAGANVILADGSVNNISGSYVARIYKEGTTKKLHKYDGAFYSKMSMNIGGESEGDGVLNITGENEGLDTELHLTINGGVINIQVQDDGINVNEDGVSVVTVNGGTLQINAGLGAEGDGIDSNGFLVINGGNVYTMANQASPDGGLDADEDILINGGYVVAVGIRNDPISDDSAQQYIQLTFASVLPAGSQIALTDDSGDQLLSFTLEKSAQSIVFSSPDLKQDVDYTLTVDGVTQQYTGTSAGGMGPGNGGQPPELPDGQQPGDGSQPGQDGQQPPQSDGQQPPEKPDGSQTEPSTQFTLTGDHHAFSGISDSSNS